VVAGSVVDRLNNKKLSEDEMAIQAWEGRVRRELGALLVIAPRHPERFGEVESVATSYCYVKASELVVSNDGVLLRKIYASWTGKRAPSNVPGSEGRLDIVLLDTIGDLAAVYGVADVAFVGGSLVRRGGHNPLEPAQFAVPVVMGPSFENFRDVVGKMIAVDGIRIVQDKAELEAALIELLMDREAARAMGERGRRVFEEQQGATARAVAALIGMVQP
jgi:3-deoxy-D-manno-octulosonic-acid transferase